ncbi:MAG: T9SS type A sorting domain-containing protein [Crocinitomicaceae bacterium]|nr:T9SS type A sorting domain-containing protein [Crocinitomicaceae bacterium]
MKQLLLILLLFLSGNSVFGQNLGWAPIGAEWYYDYKDNWLIDGYSKYSVEKDTIVNGINCRKISVYSEWYNYESETIGSSSYPATYYDPLISYEADSVIYLFNGNTFDTLMNFKANPGDTWKAPGQYCENYKTVLDTGSYNINGCSGKWISYEYMFDDFWTVSIDTFYQNIGSTNIGFEIVNYYCDGVADITIPTNLRCYSDNQCSVQFTEKECDFRISSVSQFPSESTFLVYPNPASSFITIEGLEQTLVTLYDVTGKKILSKMFSSEDNVINVEHFTRGMYFIELKKLNTSEKYIKRIILD